VQEIVNTLNANSGTFNLLLALVVAAATVFYAILTHRLVTETRRMREVQTEPAISIRLDPSEHDINFINLVVENLGQGPARDIRFVARPDFNRSRGSTLSQSGMFRHGLKYMAPGQRITIFLTSVLDSVHGTGDNLGRLNFQVEVAYRTPGDRIVDETFPLHFDSLEGYGTIGKSPLIDIAQSMEKLQRDFHHFANGFSKLQVIVSTKEEERHALEEVITRQRQLSPDKKSSNDTPTSADST